MSRQHMVAKSLLLATLVAGLALPLIAQAADSAKDPGNGLPLAPGLIAGEHPIKATICKKQANIRQYYVSFGLNDTSAKSAAWYKAYLPVTTIFIRYGSAIPRALLQSRRHEGCQHCRKFQRRQNTFNLVSQHSTRTDRTRDGGIQSYARVLQIRVHMRRLSQWILVLAICFTVPAAGYANDSVTGLPVYPGMVRRSLFPRRPFVGSK